MPSPIVVEDGTGVEGANSYVTPDDVRNYCVQRGFTLTAADDDFAGDVLLLPFVVAATDYLDALSFIGKQKYLDGLQWPRVTACVGYGFGSSYSGIAPINPNLDGLTIPTKLKKAAMQLVVEQLRGIALNGSSGGAESISNGFVSPVEGATGTIDAADGRFIKRERLEGVTDIEYSETIGTGTSPYLPLVNNMLIGLVTNMGQINVSRG